MAGPGGGNIIGRHIHVHLQQGFIITLECGKQVVQCLNVALQLYAARVHTGRYILCAQFLKGTVDTADGLCPLHRTALDHDLRAGH